MTQSRLTIRFPFRHWRLIALVGGIILLLGGGAVYGFWSKQSWEAYSVHYTSWYIDTKSQLHTVLSLQADTNEEHNAKLRGFKEVEERITEAEKNLCAVNQVIAWQAAYFNLKEKNGECQSIVDSMVKFKERLASTVLYLENENGLATIIGTLPRSDKQLNEKEWSTYASAWRAAIDSINGAVVSEPFASIKQKAVEVTAATATAWDEVIGASKAKDKTRYLKAQQELSKAYNGWATVKQASNDQLTLLVAELTVVYQAAF